MPKRPLLAVLLVSGCVSPFEHPYFHRSERPRETEWSYTGPTGPSHWGDLSPEFAIAKNGKLQSPIDLVDATPAALEPLQFDYGSEPVRLIYDGHTIEEVGDETSSIVMDGERYVLEQFHFHAPSEHTVDGRHAEMELHLVHRSNAGEVAVVAVLIEHGAQNHAFDTIWSNLPDSDDPAKESGARIQLLPLLPDDRRSWRYEGSFTTPPCTEGVHWIVLQQPVPLSRAQIERYREIVHGNNRPVQPRNGRALRSTG